VTPSYNSQREDDGPCGTGNLPSYRHEAGRENDHHRDHEEADDERKPETAQDSRDLDEKVGLLDFLLGGAPRDVVREEVRKESLGQVDRQATEEKEAVWARLGQKPVQSLMRWHKRLQEWHPSNVLDERIHYAPFTQAILQQGIADIAGAREDDDARQPDLKRVLEKLVDVDRPAEEEIV